MEKVTTDLAFNTSAGLLNDLLESVAQVQLTDPGYSWSQFWLELAGEAPAKPFLTAAILSGAVLATDQYMAGKQDLTIQVAKYKQHIMEGKKIVLVSHSKGNFFANLSYDRMTPTEQESFAVVGVAVPSSSIPGGTYTTLTTDNVIHAVGVAKTANGLPPPLAANISNGTMSSDSTGHLFEESYMSGNYSGPKILNDVANKILSTPTPEGVAKQGIVTTTLTWGSNPDVDLHIFEPTGTHVYYLNRQGASGYLDYDDTDGFGPEHFFIDCDLVQSGTYQFGLNYFTGTSPETATVLIQAGLKIKDYRIELPAARGQSGNSSPILFGSLVVTQDQNGAYSFKIQ